MCGRVAVKRSAKDYQTALGLNGVREEFPPNYNLAPTEGLPVVANTGEKKIEVYRWGFVAGRTGTAGKAYINVKAETVAKIGLFGSALRSKRCLVLADGFYEWKTEGKRKTPFLIQRRDGAPLALAGIWQQPRSADQPGIRSCAIITTRPDERMAALHDRMPVVLDPSAFELWLTPETVAPDELLPLLAPPGNTVLVETEVSSLVNNVRNKGPDCVRPAQETPP